MDKLDCINTFISVVENGNFSKASRHLNITRDQVAKRICFLETQFNTLLLIRNTRSMHLTLAGERFFEHCKVIMSEYEWAKNELILEQKYPEGELRINAPHSFSPIYLTQIISNFMTKYPNISLNLFLTDKFIDTFEMPFDVSLRISENIIEKEATVFKTFQRYFYATPNYLKQYGIPQNIDDLKEHNLLFYSQNFNNSKIILNNDTHKEFIYSNPQLLCNSGDFLLEFCKLDQGIVFLPDFIAEKDVQSGKIQRCLEQYTAPDLQLYAITQNRQQTTKVKLFLSHLTEYFK